MVEAEAAAVTAGMVEREGEEGGKGGRRGINEIFFLDWPRGATLRRSGID
jgi:hypothetical protein